MNSRGAGNKIPELRASHIDFHIVEGLGNVAVKLSVKPLREKQKEYWLHWLYCLSTNNKCRGNKLDLLAKETIICT